MKKLLSMAAFAVLNVVILVPLASADNGPQISPALKKMLGGLPIAGMKDEVNQLVGTLKKTACGGGLSGCYATKSGPLQLYFFTSGTQQQTFLLVLNKTMAMPTLLKPNVQKVFGQTAVKDPIISISTTDYDLEIAKMPADLQKIVYDSYFNVQSLSFTAGVQLAARANIGGALMTSLAALGVPANQLTLRAGVVMPIPTDLAGGAGTGAGLASALHDGDTMKKAGADALHPGAFVELQTAPGMKIQMLAPALVLTDATYFIDNELVFGYKGNARFENTSKDLLLQFQTPLTPEGVMDLTDFSFRMATPQTLTLLDNAWIAIDMLLPQAAIAKSATTTALDRFGGGYVNNIKAYAQPLKSMSKALSVFQLKNPNPPGPYRFGDPARPFPQDDKPFNLLVLGPLADGGPRMYNAGEVRILGQTMGRMEVSVGKAGFQGTAQADLSLKLGPLGNTKIKMKAVADVSDKRQEVSVIGNLAGQKLALGLSGDTMSVEFSASCVNPFEIKTKVTITPSLDIADILNGQGGVSVDPSKLENCIGKELEKALNKIANEYKSLEGFGAKNAMAALKQIDDAAKQAEKVAKQAYDQTKNTARKTASTVSNGATHAFNDAGNAFKGIGKKKKHKKGPDPHFAASVFDWDFYYDNNPDVVKAGVDLPTHWKDHGFKEGRQGSPEFSATFYRARYLDVQQRCGAADLDCVLQHWLDEGIEEGRQGSAQVAVFSYLQRYPDLQSAFGKDNYPDALDHWLNSGEAEGRDPGPSSSVAGPIYGSQLVGGDGGGAWSDGATCNGQHVTGFRLKWGDQVGAVQFQYGANGWATMQGNHDKGWRSEVILPGDEYITSVEYRGGNVVDSLTFISNKGRRFGPYGTGGGGGAGSYQASPGQMLGCVSGRAGKQIDKLIFSSTGPR